MTQARKLKKAIRSRAGKTGESYTSARRQVLAARRRRSAQTMAPAAPPVVAATRVPEPPPARRAKKERSTTSDGAVLKKTGHTLDHWFSVLDAFDARGKGHTASARHLSEDHDVPSWHCQMITVEYERAHGLRALNQSCKGDFQVSVTRTVPGTVEQIARVLGDTRRRAHWLRGADPQLGRAVETAFRGDAPLALKKDDLARMRFRWDASTVEIQVIGKPGGKVAIAAVNTKLAGPDEVAHRRQVWAAALDGLKRQLAGEA